MDNLTAGRARNTGIDALKLFSMFLIVLLHVLGQGGVLAGCTEFSARYQAAWLLEIIGYCSVNCFALATGYVMVSAKVKPKRLLALWLQVAFWSLAITAGFALMHPGTVTLSDWIRAVFPVVSKQYWYFTCYFALFFFMPALNHLLNTMEKSVCKRLVWTAVGLFSLLPCLLLVRIFLPELSHPDLFVTNNGYSLVWLAALYLLGGYVGKYGLPKWKTSSYLAIFAAAILLTWASQYAIGRLTRHWYGTAMEADFFIRYTSPTILAASTALLALFSRLQVKGIAQRLVALAVPCAFGVYLIHVQPLVWDNWMFGRFAGFAELSAPLLVLAVLGASLGIFLCCLLLDEARHLLFRLIRVERLTAWLEDKLPPSR